MAREVDTADSRLGTNEEEKVYEAEKMSNAFISVYNRIPYALIREENEDASYINEELGEICSYYKIYKAGKTFIPEGTNGDYTPARLNFKMCANLINKEARFLFAKEPDINIKPKGVAETNDKDYSENLMILKNLVDTVLQKNKFEDILLKAARDCFIGKRVAGLINFNEVDGITITFLPSTQFVFEYKDGNPNILKKFVSFVVTNESSDKTKKRIFKKKFELEETGEGSSHKHTVYLTEQVYNGSCELLETTTEHEELKIDFIPAVIIVNDGLSGEIKGESEIELLKDYEMWYSKLANADSDSERKSMNPTKYVVDMDGTSTKNLSTAAGAFWDLGSDQNLEDKSTMIGLLEPQMNYSEALKTTLERIKTMGYEQVDMPNVTVETMTRGITTGKALKAIYWSLIVRCKEKMKVWGPALESMVEMLIKGGREYPNCISYYIDEKVPDVEFVVKVTQYTPLPEDEIEEKTADLAEVESQTMSRKTYMKKWRKLTDAQVKEELEQIAYERQILEDASFDTDGNITGFDEENEDNNILSNFNGDNRASNIVGKESDFSKAGDTVLNGDDTSKRTGTSSTNEKWGN